jgi:hypothetical protein
MALLTAQNVSKLGAAVTYNAAAAGGDAILNDGRQIMVVRNAHATNSRTVTFSTAGEVDGVAIDEVAITVAALTSQVIGAFAPRYFNDASGRLTWTYSSEADLTIAIFRV